MPTLERFLYGFPPPTRTRATDKPLQILALGYSRSGTESLRSALQTLGYDHVFHGYDIPLSMPSCEALTYLGRRKFGHLGGLADFSSLLGNGYARVPDGDCRITAQDFDKIIGHCEGVTDCPLVCFAPELITAYPDAKVILNVRAVDSWYQSYHETFGVWDTGFEGWRGWLRSWFVAELYWLERVKVFSTRRYFYGDFERTGKWVYRQHVNAILGLLVGRDEQTRCLEWKVEDGWEPLCKFLGKEVPKEDFPNGNPAGEFMLRAGQLLENLNGKADSRLALLMGCVSLAIGILASFLVFNAYESVDIS